MWTLRSLVRGAPLLVLLLQGALGCGASSSGGSQDRNSSSVGDAGKRGAGESDGETAMNDSKDGAAADDLDCPDAACGAAPDALPLCDDGKPPSLRCMLKGDGLCGWSTECEASDPPPVKPGSGAFCGGFAGIACEDPQEYCRYGTGCGASDEGGKCDTRPEVCDLNELPVCGCDDKTYSNACIAAAAGVSVRAMGSCDAPQPCSSCAGPMPAAPSYACADGVHMGGPACVARPGEACSWQILRCPEEG